MNALVIDEKQKDLVSKKIPAFCLRQNKLSTGMKNDDKPLIRSTLFRWCLTIPAFYEVFKRYFGRNNPPWQVFDLLITSKKSSSDRICNDGG